MTEFLFKLCNGHFFFFVDRWVLLTATWYLAVGRGWSHDTIQRHSPYLHLIAWGVPAAKTISILVLMAVDADELTGKVLHVYYTEAERLI